MQQCGGRGFEGCGVPTDDDDDDDVYTVNNIGYVNKSHSTLICPLISSRNIMTSALFDRCKDKCDRNEKRMLLCLLFQNNSVLLRQNNINKLKLIFRNLEMIDLRRGNRKQEPKFTFCPVAGIVPQLHEDTFILKRLDRKWLPR